MYTKEELRKPILFGIMIVLGIIVYHIFDNFTAALNFIRMLLGIFSPIFGGFALAYLLNIPMESIERNLFGKSKLKSGLKRTLSLILTLLIVIGFFTLSIYFVLPQLADSVQQLIAALPEYIAGVADFLQKQIRQMNISESFVSEILVWWKSIISTVSSYILNFANQTLGAVSGVISGIFNAVISTVLGIYILISKEKLLRTFKKIFYAFTPKTFCDRSAKYIHIIDTSFENFIRGQIIEALILGTICYIGMKIFGFEYALVISFLVGITNIIPLFGPYIGAVPSLLLLVMVNPVHAFWFVIFLMILQQVESNLIYPRVVGSNMGISGFWIIFAVVLGNSLFGVLGILLGIPLLSSIYIIVKEIVDQRLKRKRIKIS